MTIRETSEELGIKVRTVREWIRKGKLDATKIGRYWYIAKEEVTRKETIDRAIKSRQHSRRIKEAEKVGMLQREGQDPEKSLQWQKCQEQ